MEQLEIENRSLWRIKNSYKNDASTDNESKQLWSFIEKDKEEVVRLLTEKARERL
jgi:DNA-binding TFAR19-related protein (PDSD5 family)